MGLDLTSTRIAQIEDYEALFENEMIAQGYGVLYGDESTEPKQTLWMHTDIKKIKHITSVEVL